MGLANIKVKPTTNRITIGEHDFPVDKKLKRRTKRKVKIETF
jgi:hypothetical protein